MTERHVCLAANVIEGGKKKKKPMFEAARNLKTRMRRARVESEQHFFFLAERTRLGTIVSLSRGGYILLVYTCTQS